jgi:hypothetical protein
VLALPEGGQNSMSMQLKMMAIAVIGIAVSVVGCTANQKVAVPGESGIGQRPLEYRAIVRDYLRKTLFDPYTVRDAQISRPKPGDLYLEGTLGIHEPGWLVCFRSNAKNRMGAYTGLSDMALIIRDGRVLASASDPTHSNYMIKKDCSQEKYEPFPEIDQLRQPPSR